MGQLYVFGKPRIYGIPALQSPRLLRRLGRRDISVCVEGYWPISVSGVKTRKVIWKLSVGP